MIVQNLCILGVCAILVIPIVLSHAEAGGGLPVLSSIEFLSVESGFILPLDSNSIFMQHEIINDHGKPITVVVSSFRNVDFDLIDDVCDQMIIYPQQMMLIPYQLLDLDNYNRYTMLPVLIDFKNPNNDGDEQIYIKKYELLLDDGMNTYFPQTVDFLCEDISIIANPKYDRVGDNSLGMQPRSGQSEGQEQSGEQQQMEEQSQLTQQQMEQQTQRLQQAQQLLQNYQQAGAAVVNSPLSPDQGPNLVEQNTAGIRDEILNEMMRNDEILQRLQENAQFQSYDQELSNDGLIQQPPDFTSIGENEVDVEIPYENDDNSATITASFEDGQITNVEMFYSEEELTYDYFWLIPVIAGIVIVMIILRKKLQWSSTVSVVDTSIQQVVVDNSSINHVQITEQMLSEAKQLYKDQMYKDAHEKFGQAIRFYYSHHFDLQKEITSIETLQILRKNKTKHFDSILDFLNLCGMIEFAKQDTDERKFFDSIDEFSKLIK